MGHITVIVIILSIITGTLGVLTLIFWFAERTRVERFAFFVATFGAFGFAIFEIAMAHAETPEQYLYILRLAQPFAFLSVAGVAWFLYSSLKTGSRWLFWTFIGLRAITVALNYILPGGVNWKEIIGMAQLTLFGEVLHYPMGIPSPTSYIPLGAYVVLMIFALDASLRAWRPGDMMRVAVNGFGVALCAMTILGLVFGIIFGFFRAPVFIGPAFLFVIAAMSFQMLVDMRNAARLAESLKETEENLKYAVDQLQLSADSGEVGLYRRDFSNPVFWSNEKAKEMFGFVLDAEIGPREFIDRVHEDDRVRVVEAMKEIEWNDGADFDIEFRIRRPDGEVRWIHCRGDIWRSEPMLVRGASVDITKVKAAEQEVHDLARKLINAQEKERGRLARDLHDHLSERIALVSIHLGELKNHTTEPPYLESKIGELRSQLQVLGSDVHRISHELHPARLTHLGLEAALRGFCREISEARGLNVDFAATNLSPDLGNELSLCFYRVAQEALQNIVKHAEASRVDVRVEVAGNELVLEISDNGKGFEMGSASEKGSLGLISISERMRAVAGTSKVLSSPGKGTTIEARAPLSNERAVSPAF